MNKQKYNAFELIGQNIAEYLNRPVDYSKQCEVYVYYNGKQYKKTCDNYMQAKNLMAILRKQGASFISFKPTRIIEGDN